MSRKRKGKTKFVKLDRYLYRSDAWQDLSCVDRCLYLLLLDRYDGTNNGRIGLGCRDASLELNVSKNTANRSFQSLEDHGFIRTTKRSGFNVKDRVTNEYRLTEYGCDVTGELPTKDFMKWAPEEKSTVPPEGHTVPPEGQTKQKTVPKPPHGPSHGTVKPKIGVSRSHHRYTYRYTIQGSDNAQPTE